MISVIVPIYKTEKYLRKCVESIQNQTYTDLEIILVDDGSPDRCGEICDELAKHDCRIKVIHQNNRGLSAARNIGLKSATGEYITFVDSDDYIELDTYEDVVKAIEKYDADLTFFREKSVNEAGETVYINGDRPTGEIRKGTKADAEKLIIEKMINGMCDKVYKADILDGLWFTEGRMYGEDYIYNLHALTKIISIAYIDRIKYSYVMNCNSVTHSSFNKNSFDQIFFKDEVANFIYKNFPKYSVYGYKRAFLARLRIMRPIYLEHIENEYKQEIVGFDKQMNVMYKTISRYLSCREKLEYLLYKYCKPLYYIFLSIVKAVRE